MQSQFTQSIYTERFPLQHLKGFGVQVCVKKPAKRRAKPDHRDFTRIFFGCTATAKGIVYIDIHLGWVKISHHAIFDEAWYLHQYRPPADSRVSVWYGNVWILQSTSRWCQQHGPISGLPTNTTIYAVQSHGYWPITSPNLVLASARDRDCNTGGATTDWKPLYNDVNWWYKHISYNNDQIWCGTRWHHTGVCLVTGIFSGIQTGADVAPVKHPTTGMVLNETNGRLIVTEMEKSMPAAKIPWWGTQLCGTWLRGIDGHTVSTIFAVEVCMREAHHSGREKCTLVFSHPDVSHGLTNDGILQVNIDQMNPRQLFQKSTPPVVSRAYQLNLEYDE